MIFYIAPVFWLTVMAPGSVTGKVASRYHILTERMTVLKWYPERVKIWPSNIRRTKVVVFDRSQVYQTVTERPVFCQLLYFWMTEAPAVRSHEVVTEVHWDGPSNPLAGHQASPRKPRVWLFGVFILSNLVCLHLIAYRVDLLKPSYITKSMVSNVSIGLDDFVTAGMQWWNFMYPIFR